MNDLMSGFHPAIPIDKSDSFGMQSKKLSDDDRLRAHIEEMKKEEIEKQAMRELHEEHRIIQIRQTKVDRQRLTRACDPATKEQYREWLIGFVAAEDIDPDTDRNKRRITHMISKDFNHDESFLVAHPGLNIPHLVHNQALKFIVPSNIEIETTGIGENQLYFMKDFTTNRKFIPYYQDMG